MTVLCILEVILWCLLDVETNVYPGYFDLFSCVFLSHYKLLEVKDLYNC